MLRSAAVCAAFVAALAAGTNADAPLAAPSFAEPAVSPDHREIAFVSGGEVWSVMLPGGAARLLVATGGNAARPMFSPDGKQLAFVDTAPGATGIYVFTLDGGALTRVTHDDVTPELDGWSPDGRALYFTSSAHNIAYFGDVMRVAVSGGTPMRVAGERFVNAMMAAPAPDGSALAFVRNGFPQWWRRGHSHIDESQIVLARADARFETVVGGAARDRWPMWSPDAATLYFVSDRSGSDELWSRHGGRLRQLTKLAGEPVLWPTISGDGRIIAFEHAFGIWICDTATGAVARVAIDLRGVSGVGGTARVTATNRFGALSLAPDGKKLAFVARGRVFVASSAADAPSQLVTAAAGAAYDLPVWSNDSRRLAFVVDRGSEQFVALAALPDGPQQRLTPAGHHDDYPHWSPDGTQLAFVRDGRELHVLDVASRADRIVASGFMDRRPFGDLGDIAFSPAGDWIAYIDNEAGFANVAVVRTTGGDAHAVSFLPNTNAGPLVWSPDGKRLFFVTSQRTENGEVAQVDLVPRPPAFREDALRRLFAPEPSRPELPSRTIPAPAPSSTATAPAPAAASPAPRETEIVFDGIRDRLTFLPIGLDVSDLAMVPDGKSLALVAAAGSQSNLYAFSIDETAPEPAVARQLTSTSGPKSAVAATPDGKTLFYLDDGSIDSVGLDGSKPKRAGVSAELNVGFGREKELVFTQAWSLLARWYADPHFHGVDWNAVEQIYEPHALGARTRTEFDRIIALMLGELNSSHLGIRGPAATSPGPPTGRLGAQWDPAASARSGVLRVAELAPLGPLELAGVRTGDVVLAIDGTPLEPTVDVDDLLTNTVGKRTTVRIAPQGAGGAARTVAVLPIDTAAEQNLWYRAWVQSRRAYVERISGGRVGYVHLRDMSEESLRRFATDLDVQNRAKPGGVVVDVRNNFGGFVDPYVVDVLTRRAYARFASRFGSVASERTELGQRVLDTPTVLVVNAHSLSDAENFTEAYRVLGAGPIVGEPTAGWIIFTSETNLADGSVLRLPMVRVFAHDGVDMELHPRPVDLQVDNPPGAAERGDDPQLAAAVRRLLRTVPAAR